MKRTLFLLAAMSAVLSAQTTAKYLCSIDDGLTYKACDPPAASVIKFVDLEVPVWSGDAAGAVYFLTASPVPAASLLLFRNGMLQAQNVDYTVSGAVVTFKSFAIPEKGAVLRASYRH